MNTLADQILDAQLTEQSALLNANRKPHRHDWFAARPFDDTCITKCRCGATRKWNGKRWIVRPQFG